MKKLMIIGGCLVVAACNRGNQLTDDQVATAQVYATRHGVSATCDREAFGQNNDYARCTVTNSKGVAFIVECPTFRRTDAQPVQCHAVRE